jgi:hypothetical protein
MKTIPSNPACISGCGLFVFLLDSKPDFWWFANGRYHRFLFIDDTCRWIRSQAHLPAGITGTCVTFSNSQRKQLASTVRRLGMSIQFFDNLNLCLAQARQEPFFTEVMGMAYPAGCLTEDGFCELQPLKNDE